MTRARVIIANASCALGKDNALPTDFLCKLRDASNVHTFRDYKLLPGRSDAEPSEVDLSTRLTKTVRLSLPIVSSPMDSVAERRMAVAMPSRASSGTSGR